MSLHHILNTHTHTPLSTLLQLSKLQNDVLVKRKALPEKTKLVAELTTAQVEVCEGEGRGETVYVCIGFPSLPPSLPPSPSLTAESV